MVRKGKDQAAVQVYTVTLLGRAWGKHRLAPSMCVVWCFVSLLLPGCLAACLTQARSRLLSSSSSRAFVYSPRPGSSEPSTTHGPAAELLGRKLTHPKSTAERSRSRVVRPPVPSFHSDFIGAAHTHLCALPLFVRAQGGTCSLGLEQFQIP